MDRQFLMIIKLNLIYVFSDFITDDVHAIKLLTGFVYYQVISME